MPQLQTDLKKYGVELPYMRVFYGKQMAIDNIYGKWTKRLHLLYTFKVEVEKASPGSVVHIDKHTVEFEKKWSEKVQGVFEESLCVI